MKKISVVVLAAIISMLSVSPIHAADKPTSVPGCTTPTSKTHAPATVKEPMAVAKPLPKTMTIETNCGVIVISMLPKKAPLTITKLSALAKAKYFNSSFCHRLTTDGIYVLQCGDPTASGSGNPTGWKGFADENVPTNVPNNYPAGTIAMANSGPNTNGSQFFIIYANTTLGPNYSIWGKVTKGLDLIKKIAEVGAYKINQTDNKPYYASDGYPIQSVEIKKITVK